MKRCATATTICLVLLLVSTASSDDKSGGAKRVEDGSPFKTVRDKASYGIGMQFALNGKKQGIDLNVDLFMQGLKDAIAGDKMLLTEQQANQALQDLMKEIKAKKAEN